MATYQALCQSQLQIVDGVITANGAVHAVQGFIEITDGRPLEDRWSIVNDGNALWNTKCLQK